LVKASLPKKSRLNAETFLEDALKEANEDIFVVDVSTRKIDEEVVHYDIEDATESQGGVLYKVSGKIQEWMSWQASDKKGTFDPLRLTIKGAAGTGKSFIINIIVSYLH
jgi:hypothetical protein